MNYLTEWSENFRFFSPYWPSWLNFPLRGKNCRKTFDITLGCYHLNPARTWLFSMLHLLRPALGPDPIPWRPSLCAAFEFTLVSLWYKYVVYPQSLLFLLSVVLNSSTNCFQSKHFHIRSVRQPTTSCSRPCPDRDLTYSVNAPARMCPCLVRDLTVACPLAWTSPAFTACPWTDVSDIYFCIRRW
jgi:hypothetical protein